MPERTLTPEDKRRIMDLFDTLCVHGVPDLKPILVERIYVAALDYRDGLRCKWEHIGGSLYRANCMSSESFAASQTARTKEGDCCPFHGRRIEVVEVKP